MTAAEPTFAERFEAERAHLVRVAYGQLGSLSEAEDVVQEAWLRLQRVDPDEIRDLRGWLTTTVSRLALDALRSARAGGVTPTPIEVDGMPGLMGEQGGVATVVSFTVDGGRITAIDLIRNPAKLRGIA
jgi:DNA-directed RNA polymerase specialized sigma24 family protein